MWILPTFNRPEQCAAVLRNFAARGGATPGVVVVNGGDAEGIRASLPEGWYVFSPESNRGALGALNSAFEKQPTAKWYGFIGDDEFVQTPQFDRELVVAAGDWGLAHGDDGVHGGKRAQGYVVIGGKLARAVGYLTIPGCWHWYGFDEMWETLVRIGACKKVFVPEVKIEHRHPYFGKGKMDKTYEVGASRKDMDFQEYAHWCRTKLPGIAKRVKEVRGAE